MAAVKPPPLPEPEPVVETKRLQDIPRGKAAVKYSDPVDEFAEAMEEINRAAGDLPQLEDSDV